MRCRPTCWLFLFHSFVGKICRRNWFCVKNDKWLSNYFDACECGGSFIHFVALSLSLAPSRENLISYDWLGKCRTNESRFPINLWLIVATLSFGRPCVRSFIHSFRHSLSPRDIAAHDFNSITKFIEYSQRQPPHTAQLNQNHAHREIERRGNEWTLTTFLELVWFEWSNYLIRSY